MGFKHGKVSKRNGKVGQIPLVLYTHHSIQHLRLALLLLLSEAFTYFCKETRLKDALYIDIDVRWRD